MPYPFLGNTSRTYTQYVDTDTWRPLQAEPLGSYNMTPVPGAGNVPVPPGDGLWGPYVAPPELPAPLPDSAPPGAPDQSAPKGRTTKPAAGAAQED